MKPVYLDFNATTPLDPAVCSAMAELLAAGQQPELVLAPSSGFGNPSSQHLFGKSAKAMLESARRQVAACVGAERPEEIVLTSGGTESINHAIKGAAMLAKSKAQGAGDLEWRNHIVTSAVEHVAISETIDFLVETLGFKKTVVGVDAQGRVDPAEVAKALTPRTLLVSVMLANNEVGTLQPLQEIVDRVRASETPDVIVHTDASQAVGKVPVDVRALGVDMLTIAGHKLYGPKGVGALYIRAAVRPRVGSFIHGANHERGARAGTENVLLARGLGTACEIAARKLPEEMEHLAGLRDRLEALLLEGCAANNLEARVNGHRELRLPNTLSISFPGLLSTDVLARLAGDVSCSAGAACHSSGEMSASHVLLAMKVPPAAALGALRLSVGRFTTTDDIAVASKAILNALVALKRQKEKQCQTAEESDMPTEGLLPPTALDYFEDTYRFESEAKVLGVVPEDRPEGKRQGETKTHQGPRFAVLLDRTIFHPRGGGQPSDTGDMACAQVGSSFQVDQVEKRPDGVVVHYGFFVDTDEPFAVGSTVQLRVDSRSREYHARLHSAGHLIDQAMLLCGVGLRATKGCHFPDLGPSVEYSGTLSVEERAALKDVLEERVNGLVQQAIPTRVLNVPISEAAALCLESQAPAGEPSEETRIVIVGGERGCPCGGTHVKNSREVGEIKIRKLSNKKGALRIAYEVPE